MNTYCFKEFVFFKKMYERKSLVLGGKLSLKGEVSLSSLMMDCW